MTANIERCPAGVMVGTGEYTTGYVHGAQSKSDKKIGVVALCLFEMRRLGYVGNLALVGTTGKKFNAIREHLRENIGIVYNMDVTAQTYPADDIERDCLAYRTAIDACQPGDFAVIFTPDDTHYEIALYAIERKIHVLLTKPPVKTASEHSNLIKAAKEHRVLAVVEYHKRYDPVYRDARQRMQVLGDFSYFNSMMTQPKFQLETFKAWAGISSDISYYLNSHHIDIHAWGMASLGALPIRVTASSSNGVAESARFGCPAGTEDTITLLTQWRNLSGNMGTAVYTASWAASERSEVHSQQRFHYMGHKGEIMADQAHRGYTSSTDADGFKSINPLYMSYFPGSDGHFAGHHGYGYKSIEEFVKYVSRINSGDITIEECDAVLPTLKSTYITTVILEAGRRSLDMNGSPICISFNGTDYTLS